MTDLAFLASIANGRSFSLRVVEFEVGADDCPLDAAEECFAVCGLIARILLQVGVLPQVDPANRHALHVHDAMHQRVVFIVGLGDQETAFVGDAEPDPAWEGAANDRSLERLLESLEVSKVLCDGVSQRAQRLILSVVYRVAKLRKHEHVVVDTTESQALGWFLEASSLHIFGEFTTDEILIFLGDFLSLSDVPLENDINMGVQLSLSEESKCGSFIDRGEVEVLRASSTSSCSSRFLGFHHLKENSLDF
mmetsp:Transcript_22291/g.26111  ORF Transcript_22291/g.26111 Transcript_22291/m.26111 type:complete len:250 (+) Transcript_22291:207-956(+)